MENSFFTAEEFDRIISKAAGNNELFEIKDDGSLETIVHTNEAIAAFNLKVEFPDNNVLVTTHVFLGVKKHNYDRVKSLLDSINEVVKYGTFYVTKDSIIAFSTECRFDLFSSLDNPFDFVFCGCKTFVKYAESILKVLSGDKVYCTQYSMNDFK